MESKTIKLYLFLLLTIFFINFSSTLLANEQATHQTNDQAVYQSIVYPKISLLTCDSGNELYSTFGHSALRVYYPESGKDIVFNFGLFDFNTPYFYTKFVRGKLKYMLGIQYTSDFIEQFKWEKRGVKEQILNLTETQTQELIDRLAVLYMPQNRYYYYSFLYKNCTSELRDIIFPLVALSKENYESKSANVTYRELLNVHINGWTKFGINLLLGSSLDRITNSYESMFLPENLYEGTALLYNGDAPLVSEKVYLYKAPESEKNISFIDSLISPFIVFSLLFAVMLFVFIRGIVTGKKKLLYIFNNTYLGLISLLGLVLIVIVLITEHTELYANYNLLWCNPLFFFVLVASFKRWRKAERLFCTISLLFIALLQIVWAYGIQYVEPGFIPIVTTLALSFAIRLILPYSSGTIVKPTSSR